MERIKTILIKKDVEGFRLDQFLASHAFIETRSQALKLISGKRVLLNGVCPKASYRLRPGDRLRITLPSQKPLALKPYDRSLNILYEDEEILVIDKPAGLVVHPAPGHETATLVNILFHQKKLSSGSHPLRPGVVHRLDKDTSGLLVLTKNDFSQEFMIEQFKKQNIKREYWAISLHPPSPIKDTIKTWIIRHPVHRQKFISLREFKKGSKTAITDYNSFRQHKSGLSWVKCRLGTGRTHQIRVHLSSISCPVVGDELYGGKKKLAFIKDSLLKEKIKKLNRVALHAHSLSFYHPRSAKKMSFKSYWPPDLKNFLERLDFYKK